MEHLGSLPSGDEASGANLCRPGLLSGTTSGAESEFAPPLSFDKTQLCGRHDALRSYRSLATPPSTSATTAPGPRRARSRRPTKSRREDHGGALCLAQPHRHEDDAWRRGKEKKPCRSWRAPPFRIGPSHATCSSGTARWTGGSLKTSSSGACGAPSPACALRLGIRRDARFQVTFEYIGIFVDPACTTWSDATCAMQHARLDVGARRMHCTRSNTRRFDDRHSSETPQRCGRTKKKKVRAFAYVYLFGAGGFSRGLSTEWPPLFTILLTTWCATTLSPSWGT